MTARKRRLWAVSVGALASSLALLPACGRPAGVTSRSEVAPTALVAARGDARDVVLVTIDTLRADAVSYSGSGKVETPAVDRLAAEGVVFENTHAHAVVTLPSHASILTGLYPYQHGIRDNARFTARADLPSLATILRAQGYRTAAFVSAFPLDRRFGLAAGFDVYDDEYGGARGGAGVEIAERPGEETVSRAVAWWAANGVRPRFLWVHLFAPHFPYEPKEPYASRYRNAPYFGEVASADAQLASLLDALRAPAARSLLLVVTSDHGESLGEHGEETHGLFAYEATLRVPLVVWAPGMLRSGRVRGHARHVDVLPTVCDLLGFAAPPGLPGRSLFSEAADDGSYFEALSAHLNRGWAPLVGRIESGMKAIRLPVPELYDLARDPAEARNLAAGEGRRHREILDGIPPDVVDALEPGLLDDEEAARLRSLGYVAGGARASPPVFDATTDPKNLVQYERVIDRALGAWNQGDTRGAVDLLRDLVARQPRMAVAVAHLASMYADLGRLDEAVDLLSRAVSAGIADEEMRVKLALDLARVGRAERGWEVLARDRESPNPETQSALGRVAAQLGRQGEARRHFERALALDPTYPEGLVDLGTLLLSAGDLAGARTHLERALAQNAASAEGWNVLGVVRLKNGDAGGARAAWEKAVAADPRYPEALFNLALACGRAREYDRAERLLEQYAGLVDAAESARARAMIGQLRAARGSR